ncbi:MAG: carboxypeptidase regulatory-like domain-containing protein [Vicinamibacterales bacterium]
MLTLAARLSIARASENGGHPDCWPGAEGRLKDIEGDMQRKPLGIERNLVMVVRALLCVGVFLLALTPVYAQNATVTGIVVDESKGVLPGVVVVATEVASGRTFESFTDERGVYRFSLPAGRYSIRATLPGFDASVIDEQPLLVGQNATIPITMRLASLEESITVTNTSPLVDFRSAQISGNVDRMQMEAIPIAGRNWLDLSANVAGLNPMTFGRFDLKLDGQSITQETSVTGFGQPGISRDAIAEYQVVTSPYDVTQGRTVGLAVQAITKSGTNIFTGTGYGYARHSKLNSAHPFTGVVLPFRQEQVGGTFGGPIVQNKTHFFASYEQEANPRSVNVNPSALAPQLITAKTNDQLWATIGRVDHQFTNRSHLVVRGNQSHRLIPNDGVTNHPSRAAKKPTSSYSMSANWTLASTSGLLQEVKVGVFRYWWNWGFADGNTPETPEYIFPGLIIGLNWNYPEYIDTRRIPIQYAATLPRGKHEFKFGGEYNHGVDLGDWPARQRGQYFFTVLPADAGRRFALDISPADWDFSGLDSTVIRFDRTFSNDFEYNTPRKTYALWLADNWSVHPRLTLNLGVRYDISWGDFAAPAGTVQETDVIINNGRFTENVGYRNNLRDLNNVGPRVGFVWDATGRGNMVIRGGTGIFYSGIGGNPVWDTQLWNGQKIIYNSYANDRLPGFIADPTRGVSDDDVLSGRVPRAPQAISVIDPEIQTPRTWRASLGFQRQLGATSGIEADVVFLQGRNEESVRDPNLFYNPETGWPHHATRVGRPHPNYGPIRFIGSQGSSESLSLPVTYTKRFSNNYQFSVIYTYVAYAWTHGTGGAGYGNDTVNPFDISFNKRDKTQPDHVVRANGVYLMPWRIQLAGVWRWDSGSYTSYSSGQNPLGGFGSNRLRSDLSFVPLNTFKNERETNLDLRAAKEFSVGGARRLQLTFEVFNLLKDTVRVYDLRENSATFQQVSNINGIRSGQVGAKFSF